MSDQESATVTPPPSEQDSTVETPPKEATTTTTTTTANNKPSNLSFSIWPPAQRTREAVVARLIETLSTPSVLSNRYGTIPPEEASAAARLIEDEAFSTAGGSDAAAEDDGIHILQVYSKEISKRMLDVVKNRASATATSGSASTDGASQPETVDPKVENETSSSWSVSSRDF